MKQAAKGTRFLLEVTATPGTFVDLGQVRGIDGASLQTDAIDVSCHLSVDGDGSHWRQMVPGFKSAGEVTLDLLFDPAEATQGDAVDGLLAHFEAGKVQNCQIIWPDGVEVWEFAAFVSAYEPSAPFDGELSATVTMTLTGAVDFAGTP